MALNVSVAIGEQISCESKDVKSWGPGLGNQVTCRMRAATRIDSNDTTILPDETVNALNFAGNKKISFMPVDVAISFPYLKLYAVLNCSIKSIAKIHFKDLRGLTHLTVGGNYIETIESNTFEDLASLEVLNLSKQNDSRKVFLNIF